MKFEGEIVLIELNSFLRETHFPGPITDSRAENLLNYFETGNLTFLRMAMRWVPAHSKTRFAFDIIDYRNTLREKYIF